MAQENFCHPQTFLLRKLLCLHFSDPFLGQEGVCAGLVDWLWAPAPTLFLPCCGLALFVILMQTTALCQSPACQGSALSYNYMLTFVLTTFKDSSCYKLPQVEKKRTSHRITAAFLKGHQTRYKFAH